jgi:hypothetical protein
MSAPAWGDQTVGDASRLNLTGIVSGTGAYLAGLNKAQHKLLHCTSTGSGFTKDHIYLCLTDGSGTVDLGGVAGGVAPHTHYDDSEGGSMGELMITAANVMVTWDTNFNIDKTYWVEAVSGTGSTEQRTDHASYTDQMVLKLLTGATSGSGANLRYSGQTIDYNPDTNLGNAQMQCVVQVSSTSSINARWGFGMENITSADDNARKFGFNLCTSVNGNWFARTANGTTRSDSDMGVAFGTSVTNLTAQFDGALDQCEFYVGFANKLTKTSDIPTSGSGSGSNLFRVGVKNSTASNRDAWLLKMRLSYYSTDNWW